MSCSSTTGAGHCSARSTRRCWRASVAARASTCAPSTATSAGTRTTRCTPVRWARCSRRCCRGGTEGADLPYGSTLCHACSDACPVKIPLGDMILSAAGRRARSAHGHASSSHGSFWAMCAPARGRRRAAIALRPRSVALRAGGYRHAAPGPATRDLPRPARESFRDRWARELRRRSGERPRDRLADRRVDRGAARQHVQGVGPDARRRRRGPRSSSAAPRTRSWRATPTCRSPGLVDALVAAQRRDARARRPGLADTARRRRRRDHRRPGRRCATRCDRARSRARLAARGRASFPRAHVCPARRRHRRDPRRRDVDDRHGRSAEFAHLDRRTQPNRRPRDDHDPRGARSPVRSRWSSSPDG